jgi:hypothetical protein
MSRSLTILLGLLTQVSRILEQIEDTEPSSEA